MSDAPTISDILISGRDLLVDAMELIEMLEQDRDRFRDALVIVNGSMKPIAVGQWMITAADVEKIVEALEGER